MKIAFLAPDSPGASPHWDLAVRVMQAAAEDLQVELQVGYSKTNTYTNRKQGLALLTDDEQPDYFVTGYWSGSTDSLLSRSERLGVKSFFVTSAVPGDDRAEVGRPREKYRLWLGQMSPDDHQGGHLLAERLADAARRKLDRDAIQVVGLQGFGDTSADTERTGGLKAYLADRPGTALDQLILAEWSRETAYRSLKRVLDPDSPVSVVWSASDAMALGAVQAAHEAGRTPGEDVFIGGFDWSAEGLDAVAAGEMEATVGGHFLQAAWALVLLHDYHRGRDFASDLGVEFKTPIKLLDAAGARRYRGLLAGADWSAVDFRQFSKIHNPGLDTYRWPLEQVFEQLNPAD